MFNQITIPKNQMQTFLSQKLLEQIDLARAFRLPSNSDRAGHIQPSGGNA